MSDREREVIAVIRAGDEYCNHCRHKRWVEHRRADWCRLYDVQLKRELFGTRRAPECLAGELTSLV